MYFDERTKRWTEGTPPKVETHPIYGEEGLKGSKTIEKYPSGEIRIITKPKEVWTTETHPIEGGTETITSSSFYPSNVVKTTTITPVQTTDTSIGKSQVPTFQRMVEHPFSPEFSKSTAFTPTTSTMSSKLQQSVGEYQSAMGARAMGGFYGSMTLPLTMDITWKKEYAGKTVETITPSMIEKISFINPEYEKAGELTKGERQSLAFTVGAGIAASSTIALPALATYGTVGVISAFGVKAGLAGMTGLWVGSKGKEFAETGKIGLSDIEAAGIMGGIVGTGIGLGLAQPTITLEDVSIVKKQYTVPQGSTIEIGGDFMKSEGYFPEKMVVPSGEALEIGMGKATYKIDVPLGKSSYAVADVGYVSTLTKTPLSPLEMFQKVSPEETTQFISTVRGGIMWQGKLRPIVSESYGLSFPTAKDEISFSEARGISGIGEVKKGYFKTDISEFSEKMLTKKGSEITYPSGLKREFFVGVGETTSKTPTINLAKTTTFDITGMGKEEGVSFFMGKQTEMKPFTELSTDVMTKGITQSLIKITSPKPSVSILPTTKTKITPSPILKTEDLTKQISSSLSMQKTKSEYYTLLKPFPIEEQRRKTIQATTPSISFGGDLGSASILTTETKLKQTPITKDIQVSMQRQMLATTTTTTTTKMLPPSTIITKFGFGGGIGLPDIKFPSSFGSSFGLRIPKGKQRKKYRPSLYGIMSGIKMTKMPKMSIGIEPRYVIGRKRHRKRR